ncbi:MAG: ATP-dependent DNA helicase [Bdellovibrionaceae bacterium]|nr:ATP-dependent DNA helicase [Pseudobdellovibrionaceae bacterium]|tara:strand:+ start:41574 stop:43817 length:2244 start_codon:yes stop_codon:yes gene_type:complete
MSEELLFQNELNPRQLAAVHKIEGPLLVVAGAGSGKTRVLTYRFANIIAQGMAQPTEILCVTFTNKAAREMSERIYGLLDNLEIPTHEPLWISTFHSTCVRILREHIHLMDYQPFFGIYDSSDQLSLVKKCLNALNINDKTYPAKGFQSRINSAKMEGVTPDNLERRSDFLMDDQTLDVYKMYELEMKRANSLDFADLLLKTNELFDMYPAILEAYQDRFKFIMVDEYQDTNHVQYKLVKSLSEKYKNLCVVGDEDQSIYSWRGADITNILSFEKDFPKGEVVKLEENYRSTRNIVEAASALIKNNTQRKEKVLFTSNEEGEKITVHGASSEYDEARFVVGKMDDAYKSGQFDYNDMAIFYRTNAQSRVLEDELRTRGLPYRIVGGLKFYERREIKDILAYLKLVLNPTDDVSLKRIINVPARGIGKTTVEKLEAFAAESGVSLFEALPKAINAKIVHAGGCKKLAGFYRLLQDIAEFSKGTTATDTYLYVLDKTGYAQKLKEENTTESMARIDNLEEFNNAIAQFESERGDEASLQSFLEEMALVSDVDKMEESEDAVTMMTLHISKGLEYPLVFIVGMENGLFPVMSFDNGEDDLEEERRLAYVGITRARKKLYLTHAHHRRVWGQEKSHEPSKFIEEIPDEYLEQKSGGRKKSKFMDRYAQSSSRPKYDEFNQSSPSFEDFSQDFYDENEADGFQKGMTVRHPTFGVGNIFKVEGSGDNQKVSVQFGDRAVKKFVVKYARLEIL